MKVLNSAQPLTFRKIVIIVVASILFWGLVSYVLVARSCIFLNCVSERSFNVLDLGLTSELFPNEAVVNPIARPSTSEGAFESGSTTVYWRQGNGLATYKIWRFRKEQEASERFQAESREMIYTENKDLIYQSSIADEFAGGCGRSENFNGYRCNFAARYQEYVVNFHSIIDQEMSIEAFNEVIIFIDEQMKQYLYGER